MEFERDIPGDRERAILTALDGCSGGTLTNRTNSLKILCMREVSENAS